jgi:hypothetical protein
MDIGMLYQFYKGYKITRGGISKVSDSGALAVLSLSHQVDVLVTEYAKLATARRLGIADKPIHEISTKLRTIVTELEKLIAKTPPVINIGKDMSMDYLKGLIDTQNTRNFATNELQRIYVEQFSGALPAAAGGSAYWPDKRRTLLRLKDGAVAVGNTFSGSAYAFERDLRTVIDGQTTLRDLRNDKNSSASDVLEMEKDFNAFRDSELAMKSKQTTYYAIAQFFRSQAEHYAQLIEAGDVLCKKEQ